MTKKELFIFDEPKDCPNCGAQISCYCRDEIRALSYWQPFGTLMLYDKIETRTWPTKYRGLVLICTTKIPLMKQPLHKRLSINFSIDHQKEIELIGQTDSFTDHPTHHLNGYAIAIGRLVECRKVKMSDNTYFLHWPELYAHVYQDVKPIKPFEYHGSQKWGTVTPGMKAKIKLI